MDDLISRQAAIDAIRASTSKYTGFMEMEMYTDDDAVEAINGVPSAQQWIPCSERLPKSGRYLVTGKKNRDWYESDKIVTSAFYDGAFWTNNGDIQAEAWMPLPEPYKGE